MAVFKVDGLDDLQHELQQLEQNVQELTDGQDISFAELFTKSFMRKYTRFSSIDDLLDAGGFHAETNEEFDAIPETELDMYIANTTEFDSWEDMLNKAVEEYLLKNIKF